MVGDRQGIRARSLVHANDDRGFAIEPSDLLVNQAAQLDPGNVLESHRGSVYVLTNDDVPELFRIDQAAWGTDRVGELLAFRSGFAADLTRGVNLALLLNGIGQVGNGHPEFCKLIGFHPDAHGVVGGAKIRNLTDAGHAQDRVVHVDRGVISQELSRIRTVWGKQGDDQQGQAHQFFDGDTVFGDGGRQVRTGLRNAILSVDLIDVDVRAYVESNFQVHGPVIRVGRHHVEHVVHTVHLLLDRCGDGLFNRQSVRAGVGGRYVDLGRYDVGKHGDRQFRHRHDASDDGNDSDNDGHDGPIDEELCHG